MRAALLSLARAEVNQYGFVTVETRRSLVTCGIDSVALEQYLAVTQETN